jgi:hypothetical protein
MDPLPCPRCGGALDTEDYGPCPACVTQLRASQQREAVEVEAAVYEPKMNVTPNAVATKD